LYSSFPVPREPLDGGDGNQDQHHEDNGEGRGEADLPVRESEAVNFQARDGRGDARPAFGGDIDDVEAGQRRDDGDGDADADFLAQPGSVM
jgi:hypothetical protein